MYDSHNINIKFLNNIYPELSHREISDMYFNNIRHSMIVRGQYYYCGHVDSLSIHPDQVGGGKMKEFSFIYDHKKYQIGVFESIGSDHIGNEFDVYFLALTESNMKLRCAYIKVYRKEKLGIIVDLTNGPQCLSHNANQTGTIIMTGVVEFCLLYNKYLGINKLEVGDNSGYTCKPDTGINFIINLEKSQMLLGRKPFYMRFGFKPKKPTALAKIHKNIDKMNGYLTSDVNLAKKIQKLSRAHDFYVSSEILELISANQKVPLVYTLREIMRKDCLLYYHIYDKLYSKFELQKLEPILGETTYLLWLNYQSSEDGSSTDEHHPSIEFELLP